MGARVGSPAFSQPASQAGTGSVLRAGAQGEWFVPGHCWAAVVEGSVTALSKAVGIPVKSGGEESASMQPRFPLPPGPRAVLPAACSLLWILLLPWLWVEKGSWSGSLENRITVKRGRFLQVTCELLPPIPRPRLPGRNFKLLPSSALATGSGSMTVRGIFLLGLLALWAELQAAPTAGKYGHAGNTRPL